MVYISFSFNLVVFPGRMYNNISVLVTSHLWLSMCVFCTTMCDLVEGPVCPHLSFCRKWVSLCSSCPTLSYVPIQQKFVSRSAPLSGYIHCTMQLHSSQEDYLQIWNSYLTCILCPQHPCCSWYVTSMFWQLSISFWPSHVLRIHLPHLGQSW
jgi:hypothetical protein